MKFLREVKLRFSTYRACVGADRLVPVGEGTDALRQDTVVYHPSYAAEGMMSIVCGVIGYLDYCEKKGLKLLVDMKSAKNSYLAEDEVGVKNAWELYFRQPMAAVQDLDTVLSRPHWTVPDRTVHGFSYDRFINTKIPVRLLKKRFDFPLQADWLYRKKKFRKDCALVRKYISLQPEVSAYVEQEYADILRDKGHVLGVICRGSDYVASKPYNHHIQPSVAEVIQAAEDYLRSHKSCRYIYLATEMESAVNLFRRHFAPLGVEILVNRRTYFDAFDFSCRFISDYRIDRENDEFLRGLEYLSSVILVSRCQALIAGLCGGSQMALLFNQNSYGYVKLFDLGVYQ